MDSPKRKFLKLQDYNRHKFFRKLAKRKKAAKEAEQKMAERELKKRLRVTPPKYGDGKTPDIKSIYDFKSTVDSVEKRKEETVKPFAERTKKIIERSKKAQCKKTR